jgi:hypothetical protein
LDWTELAASTFYYTTFPLTSLTARTRRLVSWKEQTVLFTAQHHGPSAGGIAFAINKDGSRFKILHAFGSMIGDGTHPKYQLIEGLDGTLFGTTMAGGGAACPRHNLQTQA